MPTVLLAEDDADLRVTFEYALSDPPDVTVDAVSDGRAALARLDGTVDAVVCDRGMAPVPGREVVASVEASRWSPPVVVVSSRLPDDALSEADVDSYLVKPVRVEHLRSVVVAALDGG